MNEGTYNPNSGQDEQGDASTCDAGYYCPAGSQAMTPCPAGTYLSGTGAGQITACLKCPAGTHCPLPATTSVTEACEEGYYCPAGSVNPRNHPCPPGTYYDQDDGTRADDCIQCGTGVACDWGTTGSSQASPPQACAQGHYCPAGTGSPTEFACPPGTYSTSTSLTQASECTDCPAGSYCSGGGAAVDGACAAGYFCPLNSHSPYSNPCVAGTYSSATDNEAAGDCTDCSVGHYCPEGNIYIYISPISPHLKPSYKLHITL